ncbi:MAG TPA: CHAT domain-containing protein [Thermoanaerobaculia bacterium]
MRPSEGRLTGFSYSPYVPSPVAPPEPEAFEPGLRGGTARGSESEETSPADLRQRGISWLLDTRGAERAVDMLEKAVRLSPNDASLWSDLSAAYHARAERRGDPVDLLPAFRAARRAVDLDTVDLGTDLPEARFNLALSYEKLFLPQARRAWADYLKLDQDDPAWAREAAERFFRLAAPTAASDWEAARPLLLEAAERGDLATVRDLAGRFPERVRDLVERELLGQWASQSRAGQPETATVTLNQVRMIASSLRTLAEDHFLEDVVEAIDHADSTRGDFLKRGHQAFQRGRNLVSTDSKEALESFEVAEDLLRKGDSPFAAMARLESAILLYSTKRYPRAFTVLDLLESDLQDSSYLSLLGRAAWMQGLVRAAAGDSSGALSSYRSALALFERTGETQRVARAQSLIAELSWLLGDFRGAWRAYYTSLGASLSGGDPREGLSIFYLAALGVLALDEPEAALAFQEAAVDLGRQSKDPAMHCYALLGRTSLLEKLGRRPEAGRDLKEAEEAARNIADPQVALRTRAELAKIQGQVVLSTDPSKAVESLTAALQGYGPLKVGGFLAPLHLSRARARLALGDQEGAEADLLSAVAAVEGQRERLAEEELRISYLDVSEEVYREIVRFYMEKREPARAFSFAERSRSRTLLDRLGGETHVPVRPLSLAEIQERLPDGVALVEFSVQEGGARGWVIRRDLSRVVELPGARRGLEEKIDTFRAAVESGASRGEIQRLSSGLYQDLLRDILSWIPSDSLAVFIPDGPLHRLPFAALINPASGNYLIEERTFVLAPSASSYIYSVERDAGQPDGGLLAVGDPAFDPEIHSMLSRLRWAGAEVKRLQGLYPKAKILDGEEATKERFLALAGQFATVHYAGHALVHRESPALSSLVLAGKGPGASLYSEEIYRSWFPRTRLVVLASCNSADGWTSRSEGLLSLARSFLAAGVPTVVAAAWPVNDEASVDLFTAFHRHLRAGETAPSALRSAQRELLQSKKPKLNSPASWAGVEVIGGARLRP